MIELALAFGAGAAVSSWLHFKARRRAKQSGRPPLAPRDPNLPLSGAERAAVIVLTLPPEVSASVFQKMSPEDVHTITLEISRLPQIENPLREQILGEFCASLGIARERLEEAAREEPSLIARALQVLSNLSPRTGADR